MKGYQVNVVSVVIPVYNHASFICETLDSVCSQSYANLQIIVADDASTDNTAEIVKQYASKDARIHLLEASKNQGISRNFNRAFDACTGEFIAFLGGDDTMLPGKIEKQVAFLQANPEYVLVHHDANFLDSNTGKIIRKLSDTGELPNHPLQWCLNTDWLFLNQYSGVLPSTCLARSGYYLKARYSEELTYKHELLFTLEDYYHNPEGKWKVFDEPLINYRIHDNNFSTNSENKKQIDLEGIKLCDLAIQRCPGIKAQIIQFKLFFVFQRLIFKWFQTDETTTYKQWYAQNANFWQKMYLPIAQFTLKLNLFWPIIAGLRKVKRLRMR